MTPAKAAFKRRVDWLGAVIALGRLRSHRQPNKPAEIFRLSGAMLHAMNAPLQRRMTVEDFLTWEDREELRYEFDGLRPIAMTGGTAAHAAIQANLIASLIVGLRGKPCRAFGSELKVQVAGNIRYPDAFVVCTPVAPQTKVVIDPVVVFEVLSESTAAEDTVVKNAEYRATPSILRYVILQQSKAAAIVFSRKGEDWVAELILGEGAILLMPEIDVEIPLADLYADVGVA